MDGPANGQTDGPTNKAAESGQKTQLENEWTMQMFETKFIFPAWGKKPQNVHNTKKTLKKH